MLVDGVNNLAQHRFAFDPCPALLENGCAFRLQVAKIVQETDQCFAERPLRLEKLDGASTASRCEGGQLRKHTVLGLWEG
jgi:hypothetical protein